MSELYIDFAELERHKDDQLRDYQADSKTKIYDLLQDNRSVMLQMPTGTGKTRIFASIVKDLHNWSILNRKPIRTLILAHREELIEQICKNVGFRYNIAHGVIKSKFYEQAFYPTQVASVQTLIRRLSQWTSRPFHFIIIDEAHHALADSYMKICNAFPSAKILGVTATPCRLNRASFKPIFNQLIVSYSVSEFIKRGHLCNYEYYSIKPDSRLQKLVDNIKEFDFDGDYAEKAIANIFDTSKIRAKIVDTYLKFANGKKGIIYTINIEHNKGVCENFRNAGIIAAAIDSNTKTEERKRIVSEFKNGRIDILCNVNIFSEGFDCPDVEFIQLARPTKSLSMFLQQVGRGFRTHENKDKVIILDNVGLYNRFGLPSSKRQWQRHFEGFPILENETDENDIQDNIFFIHDNDDGGEIIEGNEKVVLINSMFDEICEYPVTVYHGKSIEFAKNIGESVEFDEENPENDVLLRGEIEYGDSDDIFSHKNYSNYQKVRKGNKWGIFSTSTKQLIFPIIYDEIAHSDKLGCAEVRINDLWGLIDVVSNKEILSVKYEYFQRIFWSEYFIVEQDGVQGIVEIGDTIKIPIKNDFIWECIIDKIIYYNIKKDGIWHVYNQNFVLTNFNVDRKLQIANRYYKVSYNNRFGLVNINDQIVFPVVFKEIEISNFSTDHILISTGSSYGLLDKDLNQILTPDYSSIVLFETGILKVRNYMGCGLVKFDGTFVIQCKYFELNTYKGYYVVYDKKKWMALDKSELPVGIEDAKKKEVISQLDLMINKLSQGSQSRKENIPKNDKLVEFDKNKLGVEPALKPIDVSNNNCCGLKYGLQIVDMPGLSQEEKIDKAIQLCESEHLLVMKLGKTTKILYLPLSYLKRIEQIHEMAFDAIYNYRNVWGLWVVIAKDNEKNTIIKPQCREGRKGSWHTIKIPEYRLKGEQVSLKKQYISSLRNF